VKFSHAAFDLQVGQAIHIGGLTRLDLVEASVETIYATVWASLNVSLHMGKIENADEVWRNHVGIRLQASLFLFSYQPKYVSIFFDLLRRLKTVFFHRLSIFIPFDNSAHI